MKSFFVYFYSNKNPSEFLVEQRAKSNDQRAKTNERRAKNNEQRAKRFASMCTWLFIFGAWLFNQQKILNYYFVFYIRSVHIFSYFCFYLANLIPGLDEI